MNTILKKISKLRESQKKDLLMDSAVKAKEYLTSGKNEEIKILIKKLNDLYDSMTPQERELCIELVNEIMGGVAKA